MLSWTSVLLSPFFKGGLLKKESTMIHRKYLRTLSSASSPLWKRGVRGDLCNSLPDFIIFFTASLSAKGKF
jgi:hypothetical protein